MSNSATSKPVNDTEANLKEFVVRLTTLDEEIDFLKEDRKELIEEFKERGIDMKTLNAVMRVLKIKRGIEHKDTYDAYENVLEDTK